jgi:hypothetical protein
MKKSTANSFTRAPLKQTSSFTNVLSKLAVKTLKSIKPTENLLPDNLVQRKSNFGTTPRAIDSSPFFDNQKRRTAPSTPGSDKAKERKSEVKVRISIPVLTHEYTKEQLENITLEQSVILKDHEDCSKKQRELIEKFESETEVQSDIITSLKNDIRDFQEKANKAEIDAEHLKGKNLMLHNNISSQDLNFLSLRREFILLQEKLESCQETVFNGQADLLKLSNEVTDVKNENRIIADDVKQEKTLKDDFWNMLVEEKKKCRELITKNFELKHSVGRFANCNEIMKNSINVSPDERN